MDAQLEPQPREIAKDLTTRPSVLGSVASATEHKASRHEPQGHNERKETVMANVGTKAYAAEMRLKDSAFASLLGKRVSTTEARVLSARAVARFGHARVIFDLPGKPEMPAFMASVDPGKNPEMAKLIAKLKVGDKISVSAIVTGLGEDGANPAPIYTKTGSVQIDAVTPGHFPKPDRQGNGTPERVVAPVETVAL